MIRERLSTGHAPSGVPVMKFVLIYEGPLDSAGNRSKKDEKWEIRRKLDPQLRRLWTVNKDLAALQQNSLVREDGQYVRTSPHHSATASMTSSKPLSAVSMIPEPFYRHPESGQAVFALPIMIDLCKPITKAGVKFFPLVRDTLALSCSLKIQFLRQGPRGRVYQGGDLDGRLKLLLDALSVPQNDNEVCEDDAIEQPVYCLVEDDRLVTGFEVVSEELLTADDGAAENLVHLVITVDVRVDRARGYNEIFLGGN